MTTEPLAAVEDALAPACDGVRTFLEFWRGSAPAGRFPAQRDLDLTTIPGLVAHAFIMDVLEDRRFRYRFVGTHIDRELGVTTTGIRLDEYRSGAALESLTALFATVAERGVGGHMMTRMSTETSEAQIYERIALPVSDDGETVNKVAGAWFNHWPEGQDQLLRDPTPGAELDQIAMMRCRYFDPFEPVE